MISKDNIRIKVTISKTLNTQLKKIAEYEGRSVSNLAAYILKIYAKEFFKEDGDKE